MQYDTGHTTGREKEEIEMKTVMLVRGILGALEF